MPGWRRAAAATSNETEGDGKGKKRRDGQPHPEGLQIVGEERPACLPGRWSIQSSAWRAPTGARDVAGSNTVTALPARALTSIQVVAHRGSSDDAPEHTLSAYNRAIEDGADALECDVRLTRDGHLVCVHDRRIDRTSNGRGIVSTLELA